MAVFARPLLQLLTVYLIIGFARACSPASFSDGLSCIDCSAGEFLDDSGRGPCAPGFTYDTSASKCYQVVQYASTVAVAPTGSEHTTYDEAQAACIAVGGILGMGRTADELTAMKTLAGDHGRVWIGLQRDLSSDRYIWSNGDEYPSGAATGDPQGGKFASDVNVGLDYGIQQSADGLYGTATDCKDPYSTNRAFRYNPVPADWVSDNCPPECACDAELQTRTAAECFRSRPNSVQDYSCRGWEQDESDNYIIWGLVCEIPGATSTDCGTNPDFSWNTDASQCYKLEQSAATDPADASSALTYDGAVAACQAANPSAIIGMGRTRAEINAMEALAGGIVWIGLRRDETSDKYIWSNGAEYPPGIVRGGSGKFAADVGVGLDYGLGNPSLPDGMYGTVTRCKLEDSYKYNIDPTDNTWKEQNCGCDCNLQPPWTVYPDRTADQCFRGINTGVYDIHCTRGFDGSAPKYNVWGIVCEQDTSSVPLACDDCAASDPSHGGPAMPESQLGITWAWGVPTSRSNGPGFCLKEWCGDGIKGPAEACDDGNTESGDGCSAVCEAEEILCDLARSCGAGANETCGPARQSTFHDYNDIPSSFLLDDDAATCAKTATATNDPNPQWVRVELGAERLVGTVRFWAAGSAADWRVFVTGDDATVPAENPLAQGVNPSVGATFPDDPEECGVVASGEEGVFEASCPAATKGAFVFVRGSAAQEAVEVCEVEVFGHACVAEGEELSCALGSAPSACESCRGCEPCPAGFYSDLIGDYACTPCPGFPQPYSPPGSTSMFQCAGIAHLDGTSTLGVEDVFFNQTLDAWVVDVAFSQGPRVQINGLSGFYVSSGGNRVNAKTYSVAEFPCRADDSAEAGEDLSASLSETVCCLHDVRQDYVMTKILRDFTDTLDLIAANDKCDAEDGSDLLVNNDLEVVGEGTVFVDVDGNSFADPITIVPRDGGLRRSYYEGTQYARITIPDAELFKISRHGPPPHQALPESTDDTTYLTDQRELFIGLLDMLPTGTRVVDSANQQVSIKLTRTQYGSFAAYGEQNIDYDFISYLNARVHKVYDVRPPPIRRNGGSDQFFLEITYVYDDRLVPHAAGSPVDAASVRLDEESVATCSDSALPTEFAAVVAEACGPTSIPWGVPTPIRRSGVSECPQVSIPDDHFGRLYIPLDGDPGADSVHVHFELHLADAEGDDARLEVDMDIVVGDYVSWCDANEGSVDLAERVIPSITIGTESDNPPRLTSFGGDDPEDFATGAETLQDGLITLELALNETNGLDDNLEVFMEDVLVIHINPGSPVSPADIKDPDGDYIPSYTYDPDSRDATLHIPSALKADCSNMSYSVSFFGCTYKHVLKEEEITNPEWAYKVGSEAATTAQDFMETMLGDGTAAVAARELGRDWEQYQLDDGFSTRKKIGLWINPGHVWGQTVHNSKYSLSQDVVIYVLFGVRSGVDGAERHMLLQASGDGRSGILQSVSYKVTAGGLVESVLGEGVEAVEVQAELALPAEEACKPQAALLAWCARTLEGAVSPHASPIEMVRCVSVAVKNADCGSARRASGPPTAVVDAVIALEAGGAGIDFDAVADSDAVVTIERTGGKTFDEAATENIDAGNPPQAPEEATSSSNAVMIGAAVGAAAAVVVLAVVVWKVACSGGRGGDWDGEAPLTEVVSAGVVQGGGQDDPVGKGTIEQVLWGHGEAPQNH